MVPDECRIAVYPPVPMLLESHGSFSVAGQHMRFLFGDDHPCACVRLCGAYTLTSSECAFTSDRHSWSTKPETRFITGRGRFVLLDR
jgi:hypothetical protein